MATAYTSLLGFALPVTGELSGTWGDTVNNSITQLVEDSVAGTATQSVTSGDWTLTTTGSGLANQARCAIIRPTGTPGVTRNIIAPSLSKAYIIDNQSNAAIVFKGAATVGITVPAGKQALLAWNGSDFVQVGASAGGSNTQVQYNDNGTLAGSANLTFNGTVLTGTFSGPLNGTVGATTPTTGVFTQVDLVSEGDIRLQDAGGGQYVALQAPATIPASYTLTLPTDDGTGGQLLQTDGSGNLSWATVSSPSQAGGALIVNTTNATSSYILPTGSNAFSVGPVTVDSGVTITVSSGQRWVVI